MCVCPALKRYPRFTGTRDPDPVRLLKKLRDRKGLCYVELRAFVKDALLIKRTLLLFSDMITFYCILFNLFKQTLRCISLIK